jgi:hypothetical protein
VTRVIDQADDQNQLDPHARLEKRTFDELRKADVPPLGLAGSAFEPLRRRF